MNISENLYNRAQASLIGPAKGKQTAGNSFFESMEEMKRELADPESDFYREMYQTMQQTVRENDEQRKEDAVVDALMAIVDNMTGTAAEETGALNAKTGTEMGLAQDGDPREPLTTEMLAFRSMLGGRETFQIVEDEEDEVREINESDALHAGAAERRELSDEAIGQLAKDYDIHDMSQSEYDAFLEDLRAKNALTSVEMLELGYKGARFGSAGSAEALRENGIVAEGAHINTVDPMDSFHGDLLSWAKAMSKAEVAGKEAFGKLLGILRRMEGTREDRTGSAVQSLSEERIAALAERYDPHHMEQSEFVEFMDTLAAEGAMRPEDAEAIRNTGRWKVTVERWTLEDGNGRVIDSGTGWTSPVRMDQMTADSRLMPCLYDGGEDDGDVLAWARLGGRSAYAKGFQALTDILTAMESALAEKTAKI